MKVYVVVSVWKQAGEPCSSVSVVDCAVKESDAQKTLQREKEQIIKNYWDGKCYSIDEFPNYIHIKGDHDDFDIITLEERKLR